MSYLDDMCARIPPVDHEAARQTQQLLDAKTKPRGSLGVLEALACRLAAIHRTPTPPLPAKAVVVLAADHGVTEEGVSAYPAEVTAQMLDNFLAGGAAINVLARQVGARMWVADFGTKIKRPLSFDFDDPAAPLPVEPIRTDEAGDPCLMGPRPRQRGTANMARGPAMSVEAALHCVDVGHFLSVVIADEGGWPGTLSHPCPATLIGVGEMGIGNTTAASALTAVFTGAPVTHVTGRGTGIDDVAWKRKVEVIERALAVNQPTRAEPIQALAMVGGFEIAGLVGLMIGAAERRIPILLDGFITGAAALVAVALCPNLRGYLIASHQSVEPGHRRILEHLELRPLLNLDLRLGEGTGAVLAMHLVEAALRIVREMATFQSAGVTNTGA